MFMGSNSFTTKPNVWPFDVSAAVLLTTPEQHFYINNNMGPPTVAIIGAGVTGLATLKKMLEEGFDATAFESRDSIGGVWKYTDCEDLSVLETTISNKSRYKNSYTDFPYPKGTPAFPTAAQVQQYLESYAQHFKLIPHIHLRTKVTSVTRSKSGAQWTLHFSDGSEQDFDKVAICRGDWGAPRIPTFPASDLFQGTVLHAKAFKHPAAFAGKRVLVLGLGNNAADIATSLAGVAGQVILAHRRGANLLPRLIDGKPGDLAMTRRLLAFKYGLNTVAPRLSEAFFNLLMRSLTKKAFKLQPQWRIHPPPSSLCHQPTISDTLVAGLEDGFIDSRPGIASFTGPKTVRFTDGSEVEGVDAVIFCTGFMRDFSLVPELAPRGTDAWSKLPNSDGMPLPRLFQNMFPVEDGESLVFLNNFTYPTGFMWIADLASMAVAQVWRGKSVLPEKEEMERSIDKHHVWLTWLARRETVKSDFVQEESWLRWMNGVAGTGVFEMLGYGWKGWGFWMREMRLSGLLVGGVETPFALRLFEGGKRKAWEGAREAILRVNQEVK